MEDVVILDVDEELKGQVMDFEDGPKRIRKRKRVSMLPDQLGSKEREAKIEALRREMDCLFRYYNEVIGQREHLDFGDCNTTNAIVAALIEESSLPLSKLVNEVYEKLTKREWRQSGSEVLTQPMVKAAILFVGQRVMYGIPNADADVLEDDSETCLWCWETRDFKMIPKPVRAILNIRRTCRQKIHNRITAISAMLTLLQKLESEHGYDQGYMKAVGRLEKVFDEAKIRSLVDDLLQKISSEKGKKEAKQEQNLLARQLERNKRDAEKEQKRMDREIQKEKLKIEKGQKEAEKDERRREKEDSEVKKQLRKQQEEVEKDQRRREKEEAELKKQASVQKQASIMERFLKRGKSSSISLKDESLPAVTVHVVPEKCKSMPETCTQLMDLALASKDEINIDHLFRSHLSSWRHLGHSIRSDKNVHWGKRQKPKTELIKELKLSNSRGFVREDEFSLQKNADSWGEKASDERSNDSNVSCSPCDIKKCKMGKKLLQFDKSPRPAYYGQWPTKSHMVGPRKPFMKDLNLDYDVDSDEEWEEEEPGESLSDCDKDDEECLEEGFTKIDDDDDESEDGFMVPDGYLSENEGVLNDSMPIDISGDEARSSPVCKEDSETKEFRTMLFQQKHLQNLTELALRKNQPFIILNLMHEKDSLIVAEDLDGVQKTEQTCLQALSMHAFSGGSPIEMSEEKKKDEVLEPCLPSDKINATPFSMSVVLDSDLPTVVTIIQSCSQSINKVVEALQEKFPSISKTHLRQKVRDLSEFTENRWKVKKEVLEKLGLSASPEKGVGETKSIAKFFSKRCLPPSGKRINPCETSPQASLKPGSAVKEEEQNCIYR